MIEYKLIKSKRKTIAVRVMPDGSVEVRAPYLCSRWRIDSFLREKEEWIAETQARMKARREEIQREKARRENERDSTGADSRGAGGLQIPTSEKEWNALKRKARAALEPMVEECAREIGVSYNRIAIRRQKTRWGSCSSEGNLNFNCLLALMPPNVQRYVVVHELCHRREMNHSKEFWALVAQYQPSYKEDRAYLRKMEIYMTNS